METLTDSLDLDLSYDHERSHADTNAIVVLEDAEVLVFSDDQKNTSDSFLLFRDCINHHKYRVIIEVACHKAGISNKVREFAFSLLQFKDSVDFDSTVSLNNLCEELDLRRSTFNYRVRTLRESNILRDVDYRFEKGIKHNKAFCVEFNPDMESVVEKQADDSVKSKSKPKPMTYKKLLEVNGLDPFPSLERSTPLIRHTGPSLVEQAIPTDSPKTPRKKLATTVKVKTTTGIESIVTQIQSLSRIMEPEDLQVLYSVYTLIYHYHQSKVDLYLERDDLPKNYTPVYIEHVLELLGRPTGGRARQVIRESLQAIKDTTFDFIMLESVNLIDQRLEGFVSKTYKNFDQCSPLSSKNAKINGDDVNFGQDSMVYMVSLPDHVFYSTLSNDRLFVFPPASLQVNSLVFSIYLRFRSLATHTEFSESLKSTYKDMAKYTSFQSFKKAIKTHFLSMNKVGDINLYAEYNEDLEVINFNLWGYKGVINLKTGFEGISVLVDQNLVHYCCNLSADTRTPTIENELGLQLLQSNKIKEQVEKALRKGIKPSKMGKFHIEYQTKGEVIKLTRYSTQNEIEDAAFKISKVMRTDRYLILTSIKSTLKSKVDYLEVNGKEIDENDMAWLLKSAKISNREFDLLDLIHAVNRRVNLSKDVDRLVFGDGEATDNLIKSLRDITSN